MTGGRGHGGHGGHALDKHVNRLADIAAGVEVDTLG